MSASKLGVRPLTIALCLANLCVTALLIWNVWSGTRAAVLLATAPRPFAIPEPKIEMPQRAVNLASLQDQTLFYSARHFYVPPPILPIPAGPPKPDYKLVGTFVIPAKPTVALLSNASGASRKVKTGDDLEGWSVQAVESGRVILQYQNETLEISSSSRTGNAGMQVVPLTRTAQVSSQAGGIRLLGRAAPGADVSHAAYTTPSADPRIYKPPPPK